VTSPPFALDPRIEADTVRVGTLPLCFVLLHRDANYPWVLLVPGRAGLVELHDLDRPTRLALSDETAAVASSVQRLFAAPKMNVATLGNVVPQLHVHVVARAPGDPSWPGPVWGAAPARAYDPPALRARLAALREALAPLPGFVPHPDGSNDASL